MESLLYSDSSTPSSQQNYGKIRVVPTVENPLQTVLGHGVRPESEKKLK